MLIAVLTNPAFALNPDVVSQTSFTGAIIDTSVNERTGETYVWLVENSELVVRNSTGGLISNCSVGLGLGNFNETSAFSTSFGGPTTNMTGSLVVSVSGSVATINNTCLLYTSPSPRDS